MWRNSGIHIEGIQDKEQWSPVYTQRICQFAAMDLIDF